MNQQPEILHAFSGIEGECHIWDCPCHEFTQERARVELPESVASSPCQPPKQATSDAGTGENSSQGVGSGLEASEGVAGQETPNSDTPEDYYTYQRARISRMIDNWIVKENAKRGRETVFDCPPSSPHDTGCVVNSLVGGDHAYCQCGCHRGTLPATPPSRKRQPIVDFPLEHPPLRSLSEAAAYNDGYRAGQADMLEQCNADMAEILRVARERIE